MFLIEVAMSESRLIVVSHDSICEVFRVLFDTGEPSRLDVWISFEATQNKTLEVLNNMGFCLICNNY